ncbi:MAG: hypothetical protein GF398_10855 [Chitinivibrionales bacterium]|nr:hypothetical protein [Chitinivibrionales bacterium]
MKYWIKRAALLGSGLVFFLVLLAGIDYANLFDETILIPVLLKAVISGCLTWIVCYIIGDIVFKGLLEEVSRRRPCDVDEGLLQRVKDEKRQHKYFKEEKPKTK